MDVQGRYILVLHALTYPLDPSAESMPFRMVESLAHLRLVEEAIDQNRSYYREDDIVSDEKREQVLEHPGSHPTCGRACCGNGIHQWSRRSKTRHMGRAGMA